MMMSTTPETPPVVTMKKDEFLDIVSQKSGITKADSTKGAATTHAACVYACGCVGGCGCEYVGGRVGCVGVSVVSQKSGIMKGGLGQRCQRMCDMTTHAWVCLCTCVYLWVCGWVEGGGYACLCVWRVRGGTGWKTRWRLCPHTACAAVPTHTHTHTVLAAVFETITETLAGGKRLSFIGRCPTLTLALTPTPTVSVPCPGRGP